MRTIWYMDSKFLSKFGTWYILSKRIVLPFSVTNSLGALDFVYTMEPSGIVMEIRVSLAFAIGVEEKEGNSTCPPYNTQNRPDGDLFHCAGHVRHSYSPAGTCVRSHCGAGTGSCMPHWQHLYLAIYDQRDRVLYIFRDHLSARVEGEHCIGLF